MMVVVVVVVVVAAVVAVAVLIAWRAWILLLIPPRGCGVWNRTPFCPTWTQNGLAKAD